MCDEQTNVFIGKLYLKIIGKILKISWLMITLWFFHPSSFFTMAFPGGLALGIFSECTKGGAVFRGLISLDSVARVLSVLHVHSVVSLTQCTVR